MDTASEKVRFIERAFGRSMCSRDGRNVAVACPICMADRGSAAAMKKKLAIRLQDDANHCWVCGWKSATLLPLLVRYASPDLIAEYRIHLAKTSRSVAGSVDVEERLRLPDEFILLGESASIDRDVIDSLCYLEKRGVTIDDCYRFRVGISRARGFERRIVVPSFDVEGALNYYVSRAIDEHVRPKYVNAPARKVDIIFNEIDVDWDAEVLLVEGVFDMMKCADNAIPLLGSELNESAKLFCSLIEHAANVVVMLDDDMHAKSFDIVAKLRAYGCNARVALVDEGDPGQHTREQNDVFRRSAIDWSFAGSFTQKLTKIKSRLSI